MGDELLNIAVLVSGRGSNLQSIIDWIKEEPSCGVKISIVISDNKDAFALKRSVENNIETLFIDPKKHDKNGMETKIVKVLKEKGVKLICLAGYMRILGPVIVNEFKWRIINIHPALLPSFPGLNVQKKAIDYGVRVSGCTVHFVDHGVDTGPIIIQAIVSILQNDTEDSLSERILKNEHRIYPLAIKAIKKGVLTIKDRQVIINSSKENNFFPENGLILDESLFIGK